jgi:site-specific recombinase XerD
MNTERIHTYNQKWVKKFKEKLNNADISYNNKKAIESFQDYLFSTGSGEARVSKLTNQLINILTFEENNERVFNCEFNQTTKKEISRIIAYINRYETLSLATRSDYRRCIKQFFKWFEEEDDRVESKNHFQMIVAKRLYKYIHNEVKRAYKEEEIDPTEVLTDKNIELVSSKGCRTTKERAILKFLHESGLRAGEFLNLKIKDIVLTEKYGVANVNGKTGRRAVHFVNSMPFIVQWLEMHPKKDNQEEYFWLGESANRMHVPLKYIGLVKLVQRCFKRAGLKKRCNLHWFRHSRASINASEMSEQIMCKYFGWTIGSKQVRTYTHINPKQVEDAFLKMNGIASKEEIEKNKPKFCGCGKVNNHFARYCLQCGKPLSVQIVLDDKEVIQKESNIAVKEMMELFQKPKFVKAFMEFKSKFDENNLQ